MSNRSQYNIRFSEEEKRKLANEAGERGISIAAYIREKLFSEDIPSIYDKQFQRAFHELCSPYRIIDNCNMDEKVKKEYKQGVELLWQYLR